jgi:hypothetical protein
MPIPTVNFDPDKTIVPQKSYAIFTPAGPGASEVALVGKVANYDPTTDTIKREAPGGDNLLRPDRIVAIRQTEIFKFELEDVARLEEIFGEKLSGIADGKVRLIITDPDDEAGTVALQTNEFACSATLDGGLNFTAGEFAKATIAFEAKEPVTVTFQGEVDPT